MDKEEEIEELKDKLTKLEADGGSNKERKKLDVALKLCALYKSLDLRRGVVQYAELAVDLDGECVEAHCLRAEALCGMARGKPTHKSQAKAVRAADKGLKACGRVVSLEGLSAYRARLEAAKAEAQALDAPPPPPPAAGKAKKTSSRAAKEETPAAAPPPKRIDAAPGASASGGAPEAPRASPTTEAVRNAGGAPLSKSAWNVKDTWEEVDVTSWAIERLREMFVRAGALAVDDAGLVLKLYDVSKATGHAQVVVFQRKVRYIFDFEEIELAWVAEQCEENAEPSVKGLFKGAATLRGCANSATASDLEVATTFATKTLVHEKVKTFLRKEFREAVAGVVAAFEAEFTRLTGDGVALARSFDKSTRLHDPDAENDDPKVKEARLERARRQAFKDDLRISNPNCKITM